MECSLSHLRGQLPVQRLRLLRRPTWPYEGLHVVAMLGSIAHVVNRASKCTSKHRGARTPRVTFANASDVLRLQRRAEALCGRSCWPSICEQLYQ